MIHNIDRVENLKMTAIQEFCYILPSSFSIRLLPTRVEAEPPFPLTQSERYDQVKTCKICCVVRVHQNISLMRW